jgi:arylformamidase
MKSFTPARFPPLRRTLVALALVGMLGTVRSAPAEKTIPPDLKDVKYGPYERNVLDFWRAKSEKPTPLFVYIHGGGWLSGDKSLLQHDAARLKVDFLPFFLSHGISVASINYRYSSIAKLPAPVHDAARAIQFLRSKAGEWNLDKSRVAASGTSAGACTSLWLAYHDDLADPNSPDPVARESTRLCAAVVFSPQTSIDPKVIVPWIGDKVFDHPMISRAVGAKNRQEALAHYDEEAPLYREFSPINHVSAGDPPTMLIFPMKKPIPALDVSSAIHHPMMGVKLKEKADAAGDICLLWIQDQPKGDMPSPEDFLLKYLTAP